MQLHVHVLLQLVLCTIFCSMSFLLKGLLFFGNFGDFFLIWKWIFLWICVTIQFMIGICTCTPFFIAKMVNNHNMPTLHKLTYGGIYKVSLPGNFHIKTNSFKNYYLVDVIWFIHMLHFIKIACLFHLHENLLKSFVYKKKNKGLSNQLRLLHWWWYYLQNQ